MIVAMDSERGIGKNGTLPWYLPGDLKHFKQLTCTTEDSDRQNAVIMGRKTWESIPPKFRPLPDRLNVVLSRNRNLKLHESVISADALEEAFYLLDRPFIKTKVEKLFIIGGAKIFETALALPFCRKLYVTRIKKIFECDTFFPAFESQFERSGSSSGFEENGIAYCFSEYQRKNL